MYLKVGGSGFTRSVFTEVSAVTNQALLCVADVRHDRESGTVAFEVDRCPLVPRARILGLGVEYRQDPTKRVRMRLLIRNVVSCEVRESPAKLLRIELLFGLRVSGNQVSLCSVEEERGDSCYSLSLKVSEIDLEMMDIPPATVSAED